MNEKNQFASIGLKKLNELRREGWVVNGVSLEKKREDGGLDRGAVTYGGMVCWWWPGLDGTVAAFQREIGEYQAELSGYEHTIGHLSALIDELKANFNSKPALSEAAVQWLATGERGASSNCMFTRLTGVDASSWQDYRGWGYPREPSDFRRCQLLLEAVPELQHRLDLMAKDGSEWAALVAAWPSILAAMDEEAPNWRIGLSQRASKAYRLIEAATRKKTAP